MHVATTKRVREVEKAGRVTGLWAWRAACGAKQSSSLAAQRGSDEGNKARNGAAIGLIFSVTGK